MENSTNHKPDDIVPDKADSVPTAAAKTPSPEPVYFRPKNVTAETLKSGSIAGYVAAAALYGFKILLNALEKRPLLRITPHEMAVGSVVSAAAGAIYANSAHAKTLIYNDRAETVNRHTNDPAMQLDILGGIGGMDYSYRQPAIEKVLFNTGDASLFSWFGISLMDIRQPLKNRILTALDTTTFLSWGGALASEFVNKNLDIKRDRDWVKQVEKQAQEGNLQNREPAPTR